MSAIQQHDDALTVTFVNAKSGKTVESVITTAEHPFYVKDHGWTPAGELKAGDLTLTASGGWIKVGGATWLQRNQLAYNMEVEDFHTYFVGEEQVWVHNSCDWKPGKGEGVIYKVDGKNTRSGKPYIGRANDLEARTKNARDGRNREGAEIVGTYPIGDNAAARKAEQKAIDNAGGLKALDNKRNEISDSNRAKYDLPPNPNKD